jgi:hypothetical protein
VAKIISDRVLVTTTTMGAGSYALGAAVNGFRTIASVVANNDTFDYFIEAVDANGVPTGDWETGLGTWTTGDNVARTTIYASSNANAAVSWAAGTKRIGISLVAATLPSITDDTTTNASRFILFDDATSGVVGTVGTSSSKLYFNPSTGTLNSTQFNSLSDERTKADITRITGAIELLDHIKGVEFRWKDSDVRSAGVIAQEVEAILPELVNTSETGMKSVNYDGLIGYLIESVKTLDRRVRQLEMTIGI